MVVYPVSALLCHDSVFCRTSRHNSVLPQSDGVLELFCKPATQIQQYWMSNLFFIMVLIYSLNVPNIWHTMVFLIVSLPPARHSEPMPVCSCFSSVLNIHAETAPQSGSGLINPLRVVSQYVCMDHSFSLSDDQHMSSISIRADTLNLLCLLCWSICWSNPSCS